MEYIVIAYFGINLFMVGYFTNENLKWETKSYTITIALLCLLFGSLFAVFVPLLNLFSPILGWIYSEIKFQYRFRLTDYWNKIMLDPDYSDIYKSREEKLKRISLLTVSSNKQLKRHGEIIYNKYK